MSVHPRRGARHRVAAATLVTMAGALLACGDARPGVAVSTDGVPDTTPVRAPSPSAGATSDSGYRAVFVVQIGAFNDSAGASRLRDSLEAAGWSALLRRVVGETLPPWRVRVMPTQQRELVIAVAAGFVAQGQPVLIAQDSAQQGRLRSNVTAVNNGTHGMRAAVRWVTSPEGDALLVTEDPVSIEADPLPNGFYVGSERYGVSLQRDSVWDVAPDPTWSRVAYGRAFLIPAEGRATISTRTWAAIAQRMNVDMSVAQRAAFPASGMGALLAIAQPVIEPLDSSGVRMTELQRAASTPVPMSGGWRVRWSADGATLGVGLPPSGRIADDAPPRGWFAVDPRTRLVRGDLRDPGALRRVAWTEGPVIDVVTTVPQGARRVAVDGGAVESANGWVTLRGTRTGGALLVIGPGAALAASRSGRYVAALAPVANPPEGMPRVQLVVYETVR